MKSKAVKLASVCFMTFGWLQILYVAQSAPNNPHNQPSWTRDRMLEVFEGRCGESIFGPMIGKQPGPKKLKKIKDKLTQPQQEVLKSMEDPGCLGKRVESQDDISGLAD